MKLKFAAPVVTPRLIVTLSRNADAAVNDEDDVRMTPKLGLFTTVDGRLTAQLSPGPPNVIVASPIDSVADFTTPAAAPLTVSCAKRFPGALAWPMTDTVTPVTLTVAGTLNPKAVV